MKFFSAIFIIYLTFLAVQPCEDLVVRDGVEGHAVSIEQSVPDNCPDSAPDHECSPFCICSCRQMSAMNIDLKPPVKKVNITEFHISAMTTTDDYSHQFLDSIWQPPKKKFNA